MDKSQLHNLAKEFLEPLISGAILSANEETSSNKDGLVALSDICTIKFKAEKKDTYRLTLWRSQPFEKASTGTVTERHVVYAFVKVVKAMQGGLNSWYSEDLRTTFPRRVVAKALCPNEDEEKAVLSAIDQLTLWAGQQYEGKSISAAIGFVPGQQESGVQFQKMCEESFCAVLTNGFDTILSCNFLGQVLGHETPNHPDVVPSYAPYHLAMIAHWAADDRIALVLNRMGDILVFRQQQLCFVRRAGRWHFLTHEPTIRQMGRIGNSTVRKAVYETILDASFARTGGCIGIVSSSYANKWQRLMSDQEYLHPAISTKAKVISQIIYKRKFQNLDRRLRQELVAIDGATLIDFQGTILSVGAILKIPGGSSGGGRLAAAIELSKLGVGIKVSQDGGIKGFHNGSESPEFYLM